MSTSWYAGGDLSTQAQLKNPLKGRYHYDNVPYVESSGSEGSMVTRKGTAQAHTHRQIVESRGHPYQLLGKVDFDIGGSFLSLRADVTGGADLGSSRIYPGNPDFLTDWEGKVWASSEAASLLSAARRTPSLEKAFLTQRVPQTSTADMLRDGATAINRCAPTSPLVDLSTSFAELLREGLPSIPGRTGGNAGSEYLNYQFGIAPLASDVAKMRAIIPQAEALWAQYAENSGEHIRRSYDFDVQSEHSTKTLTSRFPHVVPVTKDDGTQESIAFSGAHVQSGTLSQRDRKSVV